MSVLSIYQVEFFVKNLYGKMKSVKTINPCLSGYIITYRSLDRLNSLILKLEKILNGEQPSVSGFTESNYYISTTQSEVKIYTDGDAWLDNPSIQPDFKLPTSDFKVIMEAWRDYLVSR